jgi:DNA-binding GntR family transcriptional regulator
MTQDAMISLLSAATRIACRQMTSQHLNALHASVERASGLSARHDWERKVTAHAELFIMLGDLTGDRDLARLVSAAAGRLEDLVMTVGPAADGIILSSRQRLLRELRAWDADGAAREVERNLRVLHYMGRVAGGAGSGGISRATEQVERPPRGPMKTDIPLTRPARR